MTVASAVVIAGALTAATVGFQNAPVAAAARSATARRATAVPGHPNTLVALGDSVAAGMGLQWRDWITPDNCWRSGSDSYAGRFFSTWKKAAPKAVQSSYKFVLLGCKGETATSMGSQVDKAIAADPGLITITIGANDLRFVYPERLFRSDGTVDRTVVDKNLTALRTSLGSVLGRLVDGTGARILVTTYHNPTAANPVGVPSCSGKCFSDAVTGVLAQLNTTIADTVRAFSTDRVRLADVAKRFEGHGAPNGWGPDAWRQVGVPSWIPVPSSARKVLSDTQGIQAYCASGHNIWIDKNWVNGIDCVHPNADGAKAYAATLSDVLAAWK